MGRVTKLGWLLAASVLATVVLAVVWPPAALVAAIILAHAGGPISWFDVDVTNERKREALSARFKRGRPEWETTPPDHPDEHPDTAWARERKRRGLP